MLLNHVHPWVLAVLTTCCVVACKEGTDEDGTDENGMDTGTDGGTGTGMDTGMDTGTDTGAGSVVCGESECPAGEVCLTFPQAPECVDQMEGVPCPEGTEATMCGGAGIPCCCGPTPPTIYECTAPSNCGETVDCACLAEVCIPSCSATGVDGVFLCEELPAP